MNIKMMYAKTILVLGMVGSVFNIAHAATLTQKDQYNLFNPVPGGLMRDMSTDRPDKT